MVKQSANKFKKMFGKRALRSVIAESDYYGDKLCLIKDVNVEFINDGSKIPYLQEHFMKTDFFMNKTACSDTGLTVRDMYGENHCVLVYMNLSKEFHLITVLERYKSVYLGEQLIMINVPNNKLISNQGTDFIISAEHVNFELETLIKNSFLYGWPITITYQSLVLKESVSNSQNYSDLPLFNKGE